jgi:hypothetical protein
MHTPTLLHPWPQPTCPSTPPALLPRSGPAGPKPWELVPRISCPILVAWGDSDPFTPLDGPVGQYFLQQAVDRPSTEVRQAVQAVQAVHGTHTVGLHAQEWICKGGGIHLVCCCSVLTLACCGGQAGSLRLRLTVAAAAPAAAAATAAVGAAFGGALVLCCVLLPCWQFVLLEGVGHCPQDDRPEVLHKELLPWLQARWQQTAAVPAASS